jgi:hypothetical protein
MNKQPPIPEHSTGDMAHAIARAAIGSVPIVGAAGAELFAYVIQEPYEKRQKEWMSSIGDAIADLRDRQDVDVDKLREDPAFADTVLAATQTALRTSSDLKRSALRNAIINTAKGRSPDETVCLTFIRYVGELNDWQVKMLALFEDPLRWFSRSTVTPPDVTMGSLANVLEAAYPEIRQYREISDQWWRDLYARGLVGTDGLHTLMSGKGAMSGRLTSLGEQFMNYILSEERKNVSLPTNDPSKPPNC